MTKEPELRTWDDLTDDERAEAILMHREGVSIIDIAEKFGVDLRKEKNTKN